MSFLFLKPINQYPIGPVTRSSRSRGGQNIFSALGISGVNSGFTSVGMYLAEFAVQNHLNQPLPIEKWIHWLMTDRCVTLITLTVCLPRGHCLANCRVSQDLVFPWQLPKVSLGTTSMILSIDADSGDGLMGCHVWGGLMKGYNCRRTTTVCINIFYIWERYRHTARVALQSSMARCADAGHWYPT